MDAAGPATLLTSKALKRLEARLDAETTKWLDARHRELADLCSSFLVTDREDDERDYEVAVLSFGQLYVDLLGRVLGLLPLAELRTLGTAALEDFGEQDLSEIMDESAREAFRQALEFRARISQEVDPDALMAFAPIADLAGLVVEPAGFDRELLEAEFSLLAVLMAVEGDLHGSVNQSRLAFTCQRALKSTLRVERGIASVMSPILESTRLVDPRVGKLVAADNLDEVRAALDELHAALSTGTTRAKVAFDLANLATGNRLTAHPDVRALAMEALVGQPGLERLTLFLLNYAFQVPLEDLQVAAIAATARLSRPAKTALRDSIAALADHASPRIRRAATAFLRSA